MSLLLALLAASTVQAEPAKPHITKVSDRNRIVCRYYPTGAGIVRKACGTKRELDEQSALQQREIRMLQQRATQTGD